VADALSDALLDEGALSVSVEDADAGTENEAPLYGEPGNEPVTTWPKCAISALCAPQSDPAQLLAAACARVDLQPLGYRLEEVPEDDWVRRSQSQFAPVKISDKLWIVPSWAAAPNPLAINLELDPGLAFGTGSHPSTRLCLRWLEREVRGGECVLDYGCGSGILAIAALRLGARAAQGVDIDAHAITAARANAERNRVDVRFFDTETLPDMQADVVIANILANPLIVLAPLLARHLCREGRIALSGILNSQADEVIRAYAPFARLDVGASEDGWVLLEGRRT